MKERERERDKLVNFQKTRKSNFRERERDKFNFCELNFDHGDFIDRSQNEVFADPRSIDRLRDDQFGDTIMIAQTLPLRPTPPSSTISEVPAHSPLHFFFSTSPKFIFGLSNSLATSHSLSLSCAALLYLSY